MASGAGRLLDDAQVFESTADAIGDRNFVYATTARSRDLTKQILSPEAAMNDASKRVADGQTVGFLFGPERSGLENDDIAKANAMISVPVNPDFPSLNLAQCVLLMAYEWRRGAYDAPESEIALAGTEVARQIDVEKLAEHWEGQLETAGFFFPDAKAVSMKRTMRNMWSRMPLTTADIQLLHGVLRQMARWKERGK